MKIITRFLLVLCVVAIATPSHDAFSRTVPKNRKQVVFSYASVVQKASPAVVNIYAKKIITERTSLFSDPFFQEFFGNNFQGPSRQRIENSLGSGVILSKDGLIVTNVHVVTGAEEIIVVLADRREYEAKIILQDPRTDLAILKINAKVSLPSIELGDSDDLEIGDLVLAIGNPFSVGQTVTGGIVSAIARAPQGISDFRSFIQTDAAINPGNSGGALVNMAGELIGINTAIFSKTGESLGIGFAVPVSMVKIVSYYARTGQELIRPWIGLSGVNIDWQLAQKLKLKAPTGMLVDQIYPKSPSAFAEIKINDIITHIDDYEFANLHDLRFRLATKKHNDKIVFSGIRAGKAIRWKVQLQAPPEVPLRKSTEIKGKNVLTGAVLENLSPKVAEEIGFDSFRAGVIIRAVRKNGPATRYGFHAGDVLLAINKVKINKVSDAVNILKKTADPL